LEELYKTTTLVELDKTSTTLTVLDKTSTLTKLDKTSTLAELGMHAFLHIKFYLKKLNECAIKNE